MDEFDAEKAASSDSPKALRISRGDKAENPTKIAAFGIPLYSYTAVPNFLQGNPYITDGYRAHLSPKLCVKSACILSNETVNIWSHMLGLIYFTLLQINDNFHFLPENGADAGDHFTFTVMNLCFQVCMFCSAGYHMFYCQSELASKRWLSLDLAGVSVGMCGCYFPGAYYAFYCDVFWRSFYTIVMMVLAFASLFAQAHSQFLSSHWYMRRLVLYSAFLFAGIVPVMHWVFQNGAFSDPLVKFFMPKIIVMYIITVIGGFFYVSQFPEKMLPDKSKYGYRMLQRMGWEEGKGLGLQEEGLKEHIKVKVKRDNRGLGEKRCRDEAWIEHQDAFDEILANLNAQTTPSSVSKCPDEVGVTPQTTKALLETAPESKRLVYKKFLKSKDLSVQSSEDLDCVLGRKRRKPSMEAESKVSFTDEQSRVSLSNATISGITTVTSRQSVQDYFSAKISSNKQKPLVLVKTKEISEQSDLRHKVENRKLKKKPLKKVSS